ncbi:MAG: histidinol-phosphate transaminase [Candidatus Omnitrophica bacterium]|nr:histidinol-phosphate transaminase [Candidatus Omnitrophota bacterium]MBU4488468.1 histidinol-phosphate transaminase [Candidatus Omnitrophota bacterium]MCG2705351.1 histidinol-phosphate transaminase [Candidatus Omnitrophota bacterium]
MIKDLVRKNILELKSYEPGRPISEIKRELRKKYGLLKLLPLRKIAKLVSNENPIGPSKKAVEAMRKAATAVNRYPDPFCHDIIKALSEELNVLPENLILGNGSDEIIEFILLSFVNAGDEVVMNHPAFMLYEIATKVVGGKPVIIPLKDYKPDLNAMAAAITPKTKLVFIDNPNNPTGRSVGEMEVEAFLEKLPDNTIAVFDEAYYDFVEREDFPDTIRYIGRKNVIILRTFSKAHGLAGLRIGYGIAGEELIRYMKRTQMPFNINSLAQAAAIASLKDKEHIETCKLVITEGKQYLYKELDAMALTYVKSDTNFILIDLGEGRSGKDMFKKLIGEGVIVRDMDFYRMYSFIRVTVGTMPENKKFIKGLKKILSGKWSGIEVDLF